MPLLRLWAERSLGLRRWMLLLLETLLTALSARAGWILMRDQTYFDRNPEPFAWMARVAGQEWRWGALVGTGAAMLVVGLILLVVRRSTWSQDASYLLRKAGWACTSVFWCSLGVSLITWNANTLGAWLAVTVGLINAGMMFHGPFVWGDADGG